MLVLSRKSQQQIHIGQDITITILQVKGNQVRVGIDAPEQVRIRRAELPPKELASDIESDKEDAKAAVSGEPAEPEGSQGGQSRGERIGRIAEGRLPVREVMEARKVAWLITSAM